MPRYPGVTIQPNRIGPAAPGGRPVTPRASGAALNPTSPALGRGVEALGLGIQASIEKKEKEREKERARELAVHNAQFNPTKYIIQAEDESHENGSDLLDKTTTLYKEGVDTYAAGIEDPEVRAKFMEYHTKRWPAYMAAATTRADAIKTGYADRQSGIALGVLENRTRIEWNNYDEFLALGLEVLRNGSPGYNTQENRRAFEGRLAQARFEGMIDDPSAEVEDLEAAHSDLTGGEWDKVLEPQSFAALMTRIATRIIDIKKGRGAAVRGELKGAAENTKSLRKIPPPELSAIAAAAMDTGDEALMFEASELQMRQNLLNTFYTSAPSDIDEYRKGLEDGEALNPMERSAVTFLEDMAAETRKQLKEDPMAFMVERGMIEDKSIVEDPGYRARNLEIAAERFNIPRGEISPLTPEEQDKLGTALSSADTPSGDKLDVAMMLRQLGPDFSPKAFRSLGVDGPVYEHVAGLAAHLPARRGVAIEIMEGMQFEKDNKVITNKGALTRNQFMKDGLLAVTEAVGGTGGAALQQVAESAWALYIQRHVRTGRDDSGASAEDMFNLVLGGTEDNPAIVDWNGGSTLLPPETTYEQLGSWALTQSLDDIKAMSPDGESLPMYANGEPINLDDWDTDVMFQFMGGGVYQLRTDNGLLGWGMSGVPFTMTLSRELFERGGTR